MKNRRNYHDGKEHGVKMMMDEVQEKLSLCYAGLMQMGLQTANPAVVDV